MHRDVDPEGVHYLEGCVLSQHNGPSEARLAQRGSGLVAPFRERAGSRKVPRPSRTNGGRCPGTAPYATVFTKSCTEQVIYWKYFDTALTLRYACAHGGHCSREIWYKMWKALPLPLDPQKNHTREAVSAWDDHALLMSLSWEEALEVQ